MTNSFQTNLVHDLDSKRKELDVYEPVVDLLAYEEIDVLEAKERRYVK